MSVHSVSTHTAALAGPYWRSEIVKALAKPEETAIATQRALSGS